jgi:hypothetical protein
MVRYAYKRLGVVFHTVQTSKAMQELEYLNPELGTSLFSPTRVQQASITQRSI